MNIVALVLAIIVGGFQVADTIEEPVQTSTVNGQVCITAERIMKPVVGWKVLKTEVKYQDGKKDSPFLEISVHNPLNRKTPQSVDARFILTIDPTSPSDTQRYNLVMAVYYNAKANVTFRRIYSLREVTIKNKVQKFPMQTPCFAREVVQIIEFTPEEIKAPGPSTDGGTN